MSTDWNVDDYRTEFESEEHWELRRNFMLAHKDRLPEDEIVCLAQVFTNIELLGCRYPEETMKKVAELAKGVVEAYREKKKSCLKRTFVAASDAASAKVKGQSSSTNFSKKRKKKYIKKSKDNIKLVDNMESSDINKCFPDEVEISGENNFHNNNLDFDNRTKISRTKQPYADLFTQSPNFNYTMDSIGVKILSELKPRFVFFLYDEHPVNLLERNASLNKGTLRWHFEGEEGEKACSVYYNSILLGSSDICSKKLCKEKAAREAIKNLQSLCYTVKIKRPVMSANKVTPASLGYPKGETKLKSDIGEQIMKLMGWSGGGLGIKQQGIIQPVTLLSNRGRKGLGLGCNVKEDHSFRNRAYSFLRRWKHSDSEEDLVFSSEFTHSQREILHKVAAGLNLKSRSYGKNNNRYMVVSKKPVPWLIVEKLIKMGGSTDRYELIIPPVTIS